MEHPEPELQARVYEEANARAAFLYLRHALSSRCIEYAWALCEGLPPQIHALRIDLRGVGLHSYDAVVGLTDMMHSWHVRRGGSVTVRLPRFTVEAGS